MAHQELHIADILRELSTQYQGQVTEKEVMERVLERRPSSAKNPYSSIRARLRQEAYRLGWVRINRDELIPLHVVLEGLRFRVIVDDEEVQQRAVAVQKFAPFVEANFENVQLSYTNDSNTLAHVFSNAYLDLSSWSQMSQVKAGDSLIVTIRSTNPYILLIEHEAASAFQHERIVTQEHELLAGIVSEMPHRLGESRLARDVVLSCYARASWRTSYPGRPWFYLISHEPRLQLNYNRYIVWMFDEFQAHALVSRRIIKQDTPKLSKPLSYEEMLLQEISGLQNDLRNSRRIAIEQGVWDGWTVRASTASQVFDSIDGTFTTIYDGPIDVLPDYSDQIDHYIAEMQEESMFADDDVFDLMDNLPEDLISFSDISMMQDFIAQNPMLLENTRRMIETLSPDEISHLYQNDKSGELSSSMQQQLNQLLDVSPHLFVPVDGEALIQNYTKRISDSNGQNTRSLDQDPTFSEDMWFEQEYEDSEFADDWDDTLFDEEAEEAQVLTALATSTHLIEQFRSYILSQGRSEETATKRSDLLWIYADFLAYYYGRSLRDADYATLDECWFYYYPRKYVNNPRSLSEQICTTLKQFFAFLQSKGQIESDEFAQLFWRRRSQIARVIDCFRKIEDAPNQFDRLFSRLFEPYTA